LPAGGMSRRIMTEYRNAGEFLKIVMEEKGGGQNLSSAGLTADISPID
jgi:hypothetical protein